ncbi:uncharacterized protein METZ01_LOCUS513935, partial [marine metagenome]
MAVVYFYYVLSSDKIISMPVSVNQHKITYCIHQQKGLMSRNVNLSLLAIIFFLSGCAGAAGISRSQCGSQQYCNRHITYWQNAIDAVVKTNFP